VPLLSTLAVIFALKVETASSSKPLVTFYHSNGITVQTTIVFIVNMLKGKVKLSL
jgi:hypothetical protein